MLGEIAPDLQDALGVDVVGLGGRATMFGFENKDWKPWTLFDGTPVLVPGHFNTTPEPNGDILMYPEGDRRRRPAAGCPRAASTSTRIVRQEPIDDDQLERRGQPARSSARSMPTRSEHFAARPTRLRRESDRAILATSAARPSATSPWCRPRG